MVCVTVRHWLAEHTEPWVVCCLKQKDLEDMTVSCFIGFMANARLGHSSLALFKTARRYTGITKVCMSLGSIMELGVFFFFYFYYYYYYYYYCYYY